jgi:signal transduction histidine kinase
MIRTSFSNRIALYFLSATAMLIVVVFVAIYFVVSGSVYRYLDEDLKAESSELHSGIVTFNDRIIIANLKEWDEGEHTQIEVNPTFVQITDTTGAILKQSPNLVKEKLATFPEYKIETYFDTHLDKSSVRQVQTPITIDGKIIGFLSVAIPLDDSLLVLKNLRMVLIFAFPLVLLVLYFIVVFIARKSIDPVYQLTHAARKITRENLNQRIQLPKHKDELHTLVNTINCLLDRLEDAVLREKQFTADASHELRTPLSALKGTLEVLLRKQREPEQYIEKIQYGLSEVNRMTVLVEHLLLLARYEAGSIPVNLQMIQIEEMIHSLAARLSERLDENQVSLKINIFPDVEVFSDRFMLEQILENLITNAIKFSYPGGEVEISFGNHQSQSILQVRDHGIGMTPQQIDQVFERFYRADESRNFAVKGNGLGMSIVKRFADILNLKVNISSKPSTGTLVEVIFPSKK